MSHEREHDSARAQWARAEAARREEKFLEGWGWKPNAGAGSIATHPADDAVDPLPVDTSGIPNDHLQYAITWFSLAAVWLLMTGVWLRRIAKGTD